MTHHEPLRGGFMPPGFITLPGIEQVQALGRGLVPRPPVAVLLGTRITEIGAGAVTGSIPLSPWLRGSTGHVEPGMIAIPAMQMAAMTTVRPGVWVRPRTFSVNYARAPREGTAAMVARARVLNTRRTMAMTEAVVEDTDGRLIGHATALIHTGQLDELPPPLTEPLQPVEEPVYPDLDPYLRPAPHDPVPALVQKHGGLEALRIIQRGDASPPLAAAFWGMSFDFAEGRATLRMPSTEWLCNPARVVDPAMLTLLGGASVVTAGITLVPAGKTLALLDLDMKFLRSVPPGGGDLVSRASVLHSADGFMVTTVEQFDPDGNRIAVGGSSAIVIEPRRRERREPERVLATVMFTDIVASTARAGELGDGRWNALLEEHNTLVRAELSTFGGREVKMMGDGVLATFDSPSRALQCARGIRDGVARLGMQVYVGLHTGECEVLGADIGGLAVNIASRVVEEAEPGEILVTGTVRDLAAGSGVRFAERGRRALKGVPDEVPLFAVED